MAPETEHMIRTLRTAMRVLGFTNREIEKRLGVSGGYVTRLFSGVMELRFEHVVGIAKAMGLEVSEIFQLAYPQPRNPPTEAAQRLRELGGRLQPGPTPPAEPQPVPEPSQEPSPSSLFEQEFERLMMKTFQKFFANMAKGAGGSS